MHWRNTLINGEGGGERGELIFSICGGLGRLSPNRAIRESSWFMEHFCGLISLETPRRQFCSRMVIISESHSVASGKEEELLQSYTQSLFHIQFQMNLRLESCMCAFCCFFFFLPIHHIRRRPRHIFAGANSSDNVCYDLNNLQLLF